MTEYHIKVTDKITDNQKYYTRFKSKHYYSDHDMIRSVIRFAKEKDNIDIDQNSYNFSIFVP